MQLIITKGAPPKGHHLLLLYFAAYKLPFLGWWNRADEAWEVLTPSGTELESDTPTHWAPVPYSCDLP